MANTQHIPGVTTVFWQRGKPHGTCLITLRGDLLCCTFLAVHGVNTRFYDVRCATHEFRRHLNSRWFIKGAAVSLVLFTMGAVLESLLPEQIGAFVAPALVLSGMLIAIVSLISLLFLRRTVRVRFYTQKKLHWIEFPHQAGEDPVLDAFIARTTAHDRHGNPPIQRFAVWLERDWLAAFPLRYVLLKTFVAYEIAPFVLFVPVLLLGLLYHALGLDRFDLENYFLVPIAASPGVAVILWTVVSLRRGEGVWLNPALRRRILKLAHKVRLDRAMKLLDEALIANPADSESARMQAQLRIAQGDYDGARDCIYGAYDISEKEFARWRTQIDYAAHLDGRDGARVQMADRRWREELEASAADG